MTSSGGPYHSPSALASPDVVSYALNAIGCSLTEEGKDGSPELERSLQTALKAGLQSGAGRAYTSLQESAVRRHRFQDADRYFATGMAYCEDRELGVFARACAAGEPGACCSAGTGKKPSR